MKEKMFCYQCQETAGCAGCTQAGVCGKQPDVAAMQDLLVYVTRGLSAVTTALRKEGQPVSKQVNHLITFNLFTTITNANFDKERIAERIQSTLETKSALLGQVKDPCRAAPGRIVGRGGRLGAKRPVRWGCSPPSMRTSAPCGS